MTDQNILRRAKGTLVGLAVDDSLGALVEFPDDQTGGDGS